jgi:hypothetical protein
MYDLFLKYQKENCFFCIKITLAKGSVKTQEEQVGQQFR